MENEKKENFIVGVDWLTYWGKVGKSQFVGVAEYGKETLQSKIWKSIRKVYISGEYVADFCNIPTSPIIDGQGGQIHFVNEVLYRRDRQMIIGKTFMFCGFTPLSLSRADLYIDFQCFFGGLAPEKLIKGFFDRNYLKNGRTTFSAHGDNEHCVRFEGLSFGARGADVFVRLYNKTKEMNQNKEKPYIRHTWRKAGFDRKKDTWRLEFETKGTGFQVVDKTSGEIGALKDDFLQDRAYLIGVLKVLTDTFFQFKINDGTKNKTRMKTLTLFTFENADFARLAKTTEQAWGRKEKVLLHQLHSFDEDYNYNAGGGVSPSGLVRATLIKQCKMQEYYNRKKEFWAKEDRKRKMH